MVVTKRKGLSPLEERRGAYRKKPRRDELSCAEACGLEKKNVDNETEWTVVNRRWKGRKGDREERKR